MRKATPMLIFVTGQTTLHWGRMEFGNIGNYYIADPFFLELRRIFPDDSIVTTLQFSDEFKKRYDIVSVEKELYYDFESVENLALSLDELSNAHEIANGTNDKYFDEYVKICHECDIFIDLSGDIWGDNADFLGKDRFEVGLIKDKIPQVLGKKTCMIAGSPGPFNNEKNIGLAEEVYAGFDLITNREPISTELLKKSGFDCSHTETLPCPSFLAKNADDEEGLKILRDSGLLNDNKPIVGFIICGWNFKKGPFDRWPRDAEEYSFFADCIESITKNNDVRVCLMSHSNGFKVPPAPFELIHGRDYPIMKQLETICRERNLDVTLLDGIYSPEVTRSIIKNFSMLVSGRLHGAVAGWSQYVPTVAIDYGHEPKAHKLKGFAKVVGMEDCVADPVSKVDLLNKINDCWNKRESIRDSLRERVPKVKEGARENFLLIKNMH